MLNVCFFCRTKVQDLIFPMHILLCCRCWHQDRPYTVQSRSYGGPGPRCCGGSSWDLHRAWDLLLPFKKAAWCAHWGWQESSQGKNEQNKMLFHKVLDFQWHKIYVCFKAPRLLFYQTYSKIWTIFNILIMLSNIIQI